MALTHKQKQKYTLLILLVGLPVYVVAATTLITLLPRPNVWLELLIYLVLGVLWAIPFKAVFKGVGQADPDSPED